MKQQLLLLQDVDSLGKKGEIVFAKPGYMRNYLLPKGLAVVASSNTLRKQECLQKERAEQAIVDRKEAEELAIQIEATRLEKLVKVDPEGHMYGSVSAIDIVQLFQEKGFLVGKKEVQITRPIKSTGEHKITIKLKENIEASCTLSILPEGQAQAGIEEVTAPLTEDKKNLKEETD